MCSWRYNFQYCVRLSRTFSLFSFFPPFFLSSLRTNWILHQALFGCVCKIIIFNPDNTHTHLSILLHQGSSQGGSSQYHTMQRYNFPVHSSQAWRLFPVYRPLLAEGCVWASAKPTGKHQTVGKEPQRQIHIADATMTTMITGNLAKRDVTYRRRVKKQTSHSTLMTPPWMPRLNGLCFVYSNYSYRLWDSRRFHATSLVGFAYSAKAILVSLAPQTKTSIVWGPVWEVRFRLAVAGIQERGEVGHTWEFFVLSRHLQSRKRGSQLLCF